MPGPRAVEQLDLHRFAVDGRDLRGIAIVHSDPRGHGEGVADGALVALCEAAPEFVVRRATGGERPGRQVGPAKAHAATAGRRVIAGCWTPRADGDVVHRERADAGILRAARLAPRAEQVPVTAPERPARTMPPPGASDAPPWLPNVHAGYARSP